MTCVLQNNIITNTLQGFDRSHKHLFYTHKYIFKTADWSLQEPVQETTRLKEMLVSLSN